MIEKIDNENIKVNGQIVDKETILRVLTELHKSPKEISEVMESFK